MFPEKPMKYLTQEEWREFKGVTKCHICFNDFEVRDKVRDHCHYTGLYRGPAHRICNLRYKIPSYIPVVFHSLSGYDAHLFIGELGKKFDSESTSSVIGVIVENKEKYISFNVDVVMGCMRTSGEGLRKRKFSLDSSTALGLWRVAWIHFPEIWLG